MNRTDSLYALHEASLRLDGISGLLESVSSASMDRCADELARTAELIGGVIAQLRRGPRNPDIRARAEEVCRKAARIRRMLEFGASYCDRRLRQISAGPDSYNEHGDAPDLAYQQRLAVHA